MRRKLCKLGTDKNTRRRETENSVSLLFFLPKSVAAFCDSKIV